jgi:hypothetical protein
VLLLPLTMGLVHFQFFDGLLFPQSCWFFNLLLGLIPFGGAGLVAEELRTREDSGGVSQSLTG